MSKSAKISEMSSQIRIEKLVKTETENNFTAEEWENLFGGNFIPCKWRNAYGKEVYDAYAVGVSEPATITLRYHPDITPTCRLFLRGDDNPYEIINVNNVDNRGIWLEIKVKRTVEAK